MCVFSCNEIMLFDYIERLASRIFWLIRLLLHRDVFTNDLVFVLENKCLQMILILFLRTKQRQHVWNCSLWNNGTCVCLSFWHFVAIQKIRLILLFWFNLKWRICKNLLIFFFCKAELISTVAATNNRYPVLVLDFWAIGNRLKLIWKLQHRKSSFKDL